MPTQARKDCFAAPLFLPEIWIFWLPEGEEGFHRVRIAWLFAAWVRERFARETQKYVYCDGSCLSIWTGISQPISVIWL